MSAVAAPTTTAASPRRMYNAAAYAAAVPGEPSRLLINNGKSSYSVEYLPDPLIQAHRALMADKRQFGAYIASRQRPLFLPWLLYGIVAETGLVVLALIVTLHLY